MRDTNIEWCDSTFNPWIGCTKVSVGAQGACVNCYAEVSTPARAMKIGWGFGKPRRRTGEAAWREPLKWERQHESFIAEHGRRRRVFCASLADVFDNEVPRAWRADLFRLIHDTQHLDWLLLTKRIGNAAQMIEDARNDAHLRTSASTPWPWPNVSIGSTIANQKELDRDLPGLLATPAWRHFISFEPLLSAVDLAAALEKHGDQAQCCVEQGCEYCDGTGTRIEHGLSWAIVGGESGHNARSSRLEWMEQLVEDCHDYGVAPFVKQLGARPLRRDGTPFPVIHAKGGDIREFPKALRVREWPEVRA